MFFSGRLQVSILDESGPENLFRFPYSEIPMLCYNNVVVMETNKRHGGEMNMRHTRWFKDKVFYQIWPRSFRDGNGDGFTEPFDVPTPPASDSQSRQTAETPYALVDLRGA